jgi:hypothetical protein
MAQLSLRSCVPSHDSGPEPVLVRFHATVLFGNSWYKQDAMLGAVRAFERTRVCKQELTCPSHTIPVVMHVALRMAGIRDVVRGKIQAAEFQALMGPFMKLYVSIEMQRFARLVGNVDDDEEEFERQARNEFNKLLTVQGDGSDELSLDKLGSAATGTQGMGMEGTSLQSIVQFLTAYDVNGDG